MDRQVRKPKRRRNQSSNERLLRLNVYFIPPVVISNVFSPRINAAMNSFLAMGSPIITLMLFGGILMSGDSSLKYW